MSISSTPLLLCSELHQDKQMDILSLEVFSSTLQALVLVCTQGQASRSVMAVIAGLEKCTPYISSI